jgi:hypothetical protein
MSEKVTARLIGDHARQIARLDIAEPRAGELAAEVERLNSAVLDSAAQLDFNDEPARFTALLLLHRQTPSK